MLTKELRDAQIAIELPAREMMAFINLAGIGVNQNNYNFQVGLANINGGQANVATVTLVQL